VRQLVKVGIFATLCMVILAVLIWKIEDLALFGEEGQRLAAEFDSVAGLDDKASVRVAGVRVGRVDGVGLAGRRARIDILLDRPLPLTVGSTARIANLGLLGEKYVEIVPGPPDGPPLPADAVLPGSAPPSFDDAMAKLDDIGSSIQEMTGSFGGDLGSNVNQLIAEVEATAREIRLLVAANRANVDATVANFNRVSATLAQELPRLAAQMDRALTQIGGVVEENRDNLKASMGNIRELTDKLETSADNLNKISGKIASGEGTLGKLVNDDQAYDEVISTLDSIQGGVSTLSDTLGAIRKFNLDLNLHGYYLPDLEESQSGLLIDVDPQDGGRLYRAGIASPPFGRRRDKTQTVTSTRPDGSSEVTTVHTVSQEKGYVATGLFGYRAPGDLKLWAGIIENSGGAQVEYPLLDKRLWLSFEAFDFNRPNDLDPHLRLTGRWFFHPNLYLVGGYDDPLEGDSFFLGGGIRWRDDNLKYLLGSVPLK
jgi:phospholipid/cholesterol/gamma-HCH transport system substrate-binding protein